MLWFDDSTERTVAEKVRKAVNHYVATKQELPTTCLVHPLLELQYSTEPQVAGVTVKGTNAMLPNHFWLGKE